MFFSSCATNQFSVWGNLDRWRTFMSMCSVSHENAAYISLSVTVVIHNLRWWIIIIICSAVTGGNLHLSNRFRWDQRYREFVYIVYRPLPLTTDGNHQRRGYTNKRTKDENKIKKQKHTHLSPPLKRLSMYSIHAPGKFSQCSPKIFIYI